MDIILATIYALVQGLTEFLPVSSSGHLVLLHAFLPLHVSSDLAFDVSLHAGTLLAILGYFWRDLWDACTKNPKLLGLMAISSVPAALVGFAFEDIIDTALRSPWIVVFMQVLIALVFFWVERVSKQIVPFTAITWRQAITIGLAQMLALIPGTSRSGITISTGMLLGLERVAAARFSFLMAVPITLGATLKKGVDIAQVGVGPSEAVLMAVGIAVSAISGIIVIRFLLKYLQGHSLGVFAWYRIGLAVVVSLWLLL